MKVWRWYKAGFWRCVDAVLWRSARVAARESAAARRERCEP